MSQNRKLLTWHNSFRAETTNIFNVFSIPCFSSSRGFAIKLQRPDMNKEFNEYQSPTKKVFEEKECSTQVQILRKPHAQAFGTERGILICISNWFQPFPPLVHHITNGGSMCTIKLIVHKHIKLQDFSLCHAKQSLGLLVSPENMCNTHFYKK